MIPGKTDYLRARKLAVSDFANRLRQEYPGQVLSVEEMDPDPLVEFRKWFQLAVEFEPFEPNAATLATCDDSGRPSARVILLKELDDLGGFVFYTSYASRKGRELAANSAGALVFYWPCQLRQIRIEGVVEKTSPRVSDAYFAQRPRGARLGAWASQQSAAIESRAELDRLYADTDRQFEGVRVPRPADWGGYRLCPDRVEFWLGQPNRRHDRILYQLQPSGWRRQRLMP